MIYKCIFPIVLAVLVAVSFQWGNAENTEKDEVMETADVFIRNVYVPFGWKPQQYQKKAQPSNQGVAGWGMMSQQMQMPQGWGGWSLQEPKKGWGEEKKKKKKKKKKKSKKKKKKSKKKKKEKKKKGGWGWTKIEKEDDDDEEDGWEKGRSNFGDLFGRHSGKRKVAIEPPKPTYEIRESIFPEIYYDYDF